MTGWTQFTARFEEEQHADALVADVDAATSSEESNLNTSYNKRLAKIVRVRLVGYDTKEDAINLLKSAGPIEAVMVATFNDTTDSGEVNVYLPERNGWSSVGRATCPEASRWDFRFEVGGLVETGLRAGQDFELEHEYNTSMSQV